jgi:FixJ family two-component response regulator
LSIAPACRRPSKGIEPPPVHPMGASMSAAHDTTVFIVENDTLARESLVAAVSSMGLDCEQYGSAEEYLEGADPARLGVVLVDLRLPGLDGLGLFRRVAETGSHPPFILMSAYWTAHSAIEAMKEGVFLLLEKPFDSGELTDGIRRGIDLDRQSREAGRKTSDAQARLDKLDNREKCVLDLILAGNANKSIEHQLGLSRRTVERIRAAILEKMGTLSFVELAGTLAECGYVAGKRDSLNGGAWLRGPRSKTAVHLSCGNGLPCIESAPSGSFG